MPITPEDLARQTIDQLLTAAGWIIQDRGTANITAGRGVAIREFPMKKGHGEACAALQRFPVSSQPASLTTCP